MTSPHAAEALRLLEVAAAEARERGELPDFLAQVERVRVQSLMVPVAESVADSENGDRLLTAEEAAQKVGMSRWWVYRNKDTMPIVRLPTGRYGFSERGLERWIERRVTP